MRTFFIIVLLKLNIMTSSEFMSFIKDRNVTLVKCEMMICESWSACDLAFKDAIEDNIFHYYRYNQTLNRLSHFIYYVI